MKALFVNTSNKVNTLLENIKSKVGYYTNDKRFVNYILYANLALVLFFGSILFNLNQKTISGYMDIRESIGRLKEISEGYDIELMKAQVTLNPNVNNFNEIIKSAEIESKNINELSEGINNEDYSVYINKYIETLDKRLVISDELINKYVKLRNVYDDYIKASKNAEKAIGNDIALQLKVKHIMLDLEGIRLLLPGKNRDDAILSLNHLKNNLIDQSAIIQEKVGLFVDLAYEITGLLRYLDTIRNSMHSDSHNLFLEQLKEKTADQIYYEGLKFSGKMLLFLLLSIILIAGQFVILTIFVISKRRIEKLQKEANDTITKSVEIAERAKIYASDAQRTQYKLLRNFCGDFDTIISTISQLSVRLKEASSVSDEYDVNFINQQKVSIETLNASIIGLERWLENYLEIYTAQDNRKEVYEEVIDITETFDKHFAEARFFMENRTHLLSIIHNSIDANVKSDKEYLLKLFINMLYISVKWAKDSWLRSSISVDTRNLEEDDDDNKKHFLCLSIINGGTEEQFKENNILFLKNSIDLNSQDHKEENQEKQNLSQETDSDSNDRFIVSSFYYMRQICDLLKADLKFERSPMEENILSVNIPVTAIPFQEQAISVPLLENKNVLLVTPYPSVLKTFQDQLTNFGLNVTALNDRYSAIGHIVGGDNNEQQYDIFIIDHNPPDIDAPSLTKIIRENSSKNLAHILVITTEQYYSEIEQYQSIFDACFIKPVMPIPLKEKLEEFIEIQLYGVKDNNDSFDFEEEAEKNYRFLVIMNEDLSTMLLKMILTKSNYHVDIVSSNSQIFELIEQYDYNFVLVSNRCEWAVPENIAHDIRRHYSNNKEAALIMVYDNLKDAVYNKLVRAGYDDFIPLPFSRTDFINTIEKWQDPISQRLGLNTNQNDESNQVDNPEDSDPQEKGQNTEESFIELKYDTKSDDASDDDKSMSA